MRYWTIRTLVDDNEIVGDEVIGIVKVSWPYPSIKQGILRILDEQLGHEKWWLDSITKVEFETYQAFDIKEYRI